MVPDLVGRRRLTQYLGHDTFLSHGNMHPGFPEALLVIMKRLAAWLVHAQN